MKKLLLIFLLLFNYVFANEVDSVDSVVAYIGDMKAISVAMLPFQPTTPETMTKNRPDMVIASDLDFSHNFNLHKVTEVDSVLFKENDVLYYITGTYSKSGDSISMEIVFHDYVSGMVIEKQQFRFHQKIARKVGHDFANYVHDYVLAEKGPFNSKITYVRRATKGKNVYIMDYDGGNSWAVTKKGLNLMPAFYGQGGLFWISYGRGKPDLYKANFSTGKSSVVASSRKVEASPDYNAIVGRVVFASSRRGNMDVYTCRPDGSGLKQLTVSGAIDGSPCWSPNGYNIAFLSDRSGSPQIYIMDKDGGSLRKLTYNSTYHDSPAWSPDGERIAYTSIRKGKFSIFTIAVDGTDEKEITVNVPGNNRYPAWSPDGKHIAFSSSRGRSTDIYIVTIKSGKVRRVTKTGDAEMPAWSELAK